LQEGGAALDMAEAYYLEAIEFSNRYFQNKEEYRYLPLNRLFKLYITRGDYKRSDRAYTELAGIISNLKGHDYKFKASSLGLYALFAERNFDLERAAALRQESLKALKKSNVRMQSRRYVDVLLDIVMDDLRLQRIEEARMGLADLRKLLRKKKKTVQYRRYLGLLGVFYETIGEFDKAEKSFNGLHKGVLKTPGASGIDLVVAERVRAAFYLRRSQIEQSSYYYNQALERLEGYNEMYPMLYQELLLGAAIADYKAGDTDLALHRADIIERLLFDGFNEHFFFLTEFEKELYVEQVEKVIGSLNAMRLDAEHTEQVGLVFNNMLAVKSVALDASRLIRKLLMNGIEDDHKQAYAAILEAREQSRLKRIEGTESLELNAKIQDSIRMSESALLRELANLGTMQVYRVNQFDWHDVQQNLKPFEVAIEFVRVPCDPVISAGFKYYALIIHRELVKPIKLELFKEDELEAILAINKPAYEKYNKIYSGASFDRIYGLIWKPLEDYLDGVETVYVSLSGILHEVPMAVLTINESYSLKVLSSMRNLIHTDIDRSHGGYEKAVLYGGIDYDYDRGNLNVKVRSLQINDIAENVYRAGYAPLPATLDEIRDIAHILNKVYVETFKFSKDEATEHSFKHIGNKRPDIIHVATHGFYFSPEKSFHVEELFGYSIQRGSIAQNPLFRSGLLFAGANQKDIDVYGEDGILTAYEISRLDLSKVDLVVLSACETGLGDIRGSEGVYGLQRAFKMAGVNSMVLSLWKVSDIETAELMKSFYLNLIDNQFDKQLALKNAQKEMRLRYPDKPFFWGAFVLVE
jgi:CHAT domain-containing protein